MSDAKLRRAIEILRAKYKPDWTLEEIAQRCALDRRVFNSANPKAETLWRIAEVMGVPVTVLVATMEGIQ